MGNIYEKAYDFALTFAMLKGARRSLARIRRNAYTRSAVELMRAEDHVRLLSKHLKVAFKAYKAAEVKGGEE